MSGKGAIIANARGVAQLGRARGSGLRGRRFKSCRPDLSQDISNYAGVLFLRDTPGKRLPCLHEQAFAGQRSSSGNAVR